MSVFLKEKINIRSDNLQSAIVKKSKNKSLSSKSLDKLERVIITQYNFKNGETKLILGNTFCISNVNSEGISRFIKDIKSIKSDKTSSFINSRIDSWEANAKKLLETNSEPKKINQLLGKGSRGYVYKDDNTIVKQTKNLTQNEISHETNMCNEYNMKK